MRHFRPCSHAAIAYMALQGVDSVMSLSHLHGLDLNDTQCDWPSLLHLRVVVILGLGSIWAAD